MGNPSAVQAHNSTTMIRPVPALTISFTKKEGFQPTLKRREGVCLPDLNWELVPEKWGLIAEGSAPQTHFGDPRNYKQAAFWEHSDLDG